MDTSPKYNFPWDLISESLAGTLQEPGQLQLNQWLSSDPDNQKKYIQIKELWKNGMQDYKLYKNADEEESWKLLQNKLNLIEPAPAVTHFLQKKHVLKPKTIRRLIAMAAILIGLAGIGLWLMLTKNNPLIYETTAMVQKKIILTDGSVITMGPLSKIEVYHNYDRKNRSIRMFSGKVYFDVKHQTNHPFIVEMGVTQIKDIGTCFSVQKNDNQIMVAVTSGKVVFINTATKESIELKDGANITFDIVHESFGNLSSNQSPESDEQLLTFDNATLPEVVNALQKVYSKKIEIQVYNIDSKRITAQLGGMSYNKALQVICKSLNLDYSITDSVSVLKDKIKEQP